MKKQLINANINHYDGKFSACYECIGVESCKWALCEEMPPTGNEACYHSDHGSCHCDSAQGDVLEHLVIKIKAEIKSLSDSEN